MKAVVRGEEVNEHFFFDFVDVQYCWGTYDSLLDPLVMRIHQFTAQIHCHLRPFDVRKQIVQRRTHNQPEFEFLFEEFRTDLGYGLLKEPRRPYHVHHMNDSRKIWLEIEHRKIVKNCWSDGLLLNFPLTEIFKSTAFTAVHRSLRRSIIKLNPKSASCKLKTIARKKQKRINVELIVCCVTLTYGGTAVKYEINFS